ncbi:MAG TPA: asparagine synthase-related protein [Rhizomicrobium sp.]|jgi:hypothetical protein|nr:asparagine synthase-related protein [Rhizomicrobium sp.]
MSPGEDGPAEPGSGYEILETDLCTIRWKGFLFVRGCLAGKESAARILAEWRRSGPEHALALGKGSFALCVVEKPSQAFWYAVDSFGLMRLFVSARMVNDDFFAHIRRLGADRECIDREALAAFFRFGFYDRQRTLDRRIRVLAGNEIARLPAGGTVRLLQKLTPDREAQTVPFDFDAYIRDLSLAISSERISLDLTGGFDSRLVAASLAQACAPIMEAVTSGQERNRDVGIARRIAAKLGLTHVWNRHQIAGFENRARKHLHLTQGQMGILTYDHMYQIQTGRVSRGMTLGIGGAGGELWKDFLWLQDFPWLTGQPDFQRLYRRRLEPRKPSGAFLTPGIAASFDSAASDYMAEMHERFGRLPRTAGYDSVYAELRLPFLMGPSVTAAVGLGIPHFSPLLDREGVSFSIRRPHGERLFSRWHRHTIARVAPPLLRERTTEGLSARSGLAAVTDAPFYLADKIGRAAQKISQRLNLPDVVQHAVEDPQTLGYAQRLRVSEDAIERLKAFDIVSGSTGPQQLSRAALDRALTAGLTLLEMMP